MKIRVKENLYYWNGMACMAVCEIEGGGLAFALMIDDNPMTHYVVRASLHRINAIKNNCTTIWEAFRHREFALAYQVHGLDDGVQEYVEAEYIPGFDYSLLSRPGMRLHNAGKARAKLRRRLTRSRKFGKYMKKVA